MVFEGRGRRVLGELSPRVWGQGGTKKPRNWIGTGFEIVFFGHIDVGGLLWNEGCTITESGGIGCFTRGCSNLKRCQESRCKTVAHLARS